MSAPQSHRTTAVATLTVDWTRCDAHGLCAEALPERITLDEWGFPMIDGRPLGSAEIARARAAALACPVLALRVERTG